MLPKTIERSTSFGEKHQLTWVDRLGVWLSGRQVRRFVPSFEGKSVGDFGCGYSARFARTLLEDASSLTLIDVSLATDLKQDARIRAIEGHLPGAISSVESDSLDVILLLSVLEHIWNPTEALQECHRVLKPRGVCLINVPNWRGKYWLELSAFKLGLSPKSEMDDHKCYYDPKDLWPLLVRVGFLPSQIQCFQHKFGLNTFAVCQRSSRTKNHGYGINRD